MREFKIGDLAKVIGSNAHHNFAVGDVVEIVDILDYGVLECAPPDTIGLTQYMIPTELQPVGLSLFELLAAQPLPASLAQHFKRVDSILELFESMPHGYILQCIQEVSLTPLERAALGCLLTQYQELI